MCNIVIIKLSFFRNFFVLFHFGFVMYFIYIFNTIQYANVQFGFVVLRAYRFCLQLIQFGDIKQVPRYIQM